MISGAASINNGGRGDIHIFMLTDCKDNRFQKKFIMQNLSFQKFLCISEGRVRKCPMTSQGRHTCKLINACKINLVPKSGLLFVDLIKVKSDSTQ